VGGQFAGGVEAVLKLFDPGIKNFIKLSANAESAGSGFFSGLAVPQAAVNFLLQFLDLLRL